MTLPRGDVGLGGGGMSSSSAKIRLFPWSPRLLALSMQWASRALSSPSPCLRRPPNPPSSAASSRASPPILTASVVGRSLFFAIAGRRGCHRHRLPRPRLPPLPNLVVPSPPPARPLSHPSPILSLLMMHSSPAPQGMFFRTEETATNHASIIPDCLPLREMSQL
jgi:hypothetical protein